MNTNVIRIKKTTRRLVAVTQNDRGSANSLAFPSLTTLWTLALNILEFGSERHQFPLFLGSNSIL